MTMKRALTMLIAAFALLCCLAVFFASLHGLPRFYIEFLWQSCLLFGSFGLITGFACAYLSRAVDKPTETSSESHDGEQLAWSHNLKAKDAQASDRVEPVDTLLTAMRQRSAALANMQSSKKDGQRNRPTY
jgi:hypothetical protein